MGAEVVRFLIEDGADLDRGTENKLSPLISATMSGHAEAVRVLLDAGANKNGAKDDGGTALFSASCRGHTEIVRMLCEHGADVDKACLDGESNLMTAAEKGHMEIVELLVEHGANIKKRSGGRTALTAADEAGQLEVEEYLKDKLRERGEDEGAGCSWPVFITLFLSVGLVVFFGWLTHFLNQKDKARFKRMSQEL